MRSHIALFVLSVLVLLMPQAGLCDSIVVSGTAHSSVDNYATRQTVSLGDELWVETEHTGFPVQQQFTIPLAYSIPTGFQLTSATLVFSMTGTLTSTVTESSVPLAGSENDFVPSGLRGVSEYDGPWMVAQVGDQWFWLTTEPNTAGSIDLMASGFGDLLRQGMPVSVLSSVWMFCYVDAVGPQWWGRNAESSVRVDQSWDGDYTAELRLTVERVPEPSTLILLLTGSALIARRRRQRLS